MSQVNEQALQDAQTLLRRAKLAATRLLHQARQEGWEAYAEDLAQYLTLGVRPDPALMALLEGDMYRLLRHADLNLRHHALGVAQALVEHAPRTAYGSAIEGWMTEVQAACKRVKGYAAPGD